MDNRMEQLQKLIDDLTAEIDIDKIYLSKDEVEDVEKKVLLILISNKSEKTVHELEPLVIFILNSQPGLNFKVYQSHQIKEFLSKGNLYFYRLCSQENIVYEGTGCIPVFPLKPPFNDLMEVAKNVFLRDINKCTIWYRGALFFYESGEFEHSAFMLHQYIEHTFCTVETFILGMRKRSHSIRVHQLHLAPYVPELSDIFAKMKEDDEELFSKLENAYLGRYKPSYSVSKEFIESLIESAKQAMEIAHNTFEELMGYFKSKRPYKILEPVFSVNEEPINFITSLITEELPVDYIYKVAEKSFQSMSKSVISNNEIINDNHYTLLVITTQSSNLSYSNISSHISNLKPELKTSVTLLVHSLSSVKEYIKNGNRFFCTYLPNAQLFYKRPGIKDKNDLLSNSDFSTLIEDYTIAHSNWLTKITRADGFFIAADAAEESDEGEVAVSLYSQSIELACLASINFFLGYKPLIQTLNHLFELCHILTGKFAEIFPRQSDEDKRIFKIIASAVGDVRYRGAFSISPIVVGVMRKKCELILELSKGLVQEKMKSISPQKIKINEVLEQINV